MRPPAGVVGGVIEKLKLLTDAQFAEVEFPMADFCRLRAAYIEFFIKEKQPFPLKKEKQLPFSKICCHMEIQPRVLATELIRMIAAKTGQR